MESDAHNRQPGRQSFFVRFRPLIIGAILGYSFGFIAGFLHHDPLTGIVPGVTGGILLGVAWWRQWQGWIRWMMITVLCALFVIVCVDPLMVLYQREMGL